MFRPLSRDASRELDESCLRQPETAGAVEAGQVRFEIDMQPFGAALTSEARCLPNHARRDPLPAHVGVDRCIEDEGVDAAVPGDIDETDEPVVVVGADMGEAAGQDGSEIAGFRGAPDG